MRTMKTQKLKNRFKNGVLAGLTILLVMLTALGWVGDMSLADLPADSWLGRLYISLSYGEAGGFELRLGEIAAALPAECAVHGEQGEMTGAQYSESAVRAFLGAYGQSLGTALATAGELRQGAEADFRLALKEPGIFLRYDSALPLSLITHWLGGNPPDRSGVDPAVQALFVGTDAKLWVRAADGTLYRTELGVAPDTTPRTELSGTACTFAAQTMPDQSAVLPETLLFSQTLELPVIASTAPSFGTEDTTASLALLLEAFQYDPYVRNYPDESTGRRVFVATQSTLRVGSDGSVLFRANTEEGGLEAYLENEVDSQTPLLYQVDYARSLLETVFQSFSPGATCFFDRSETDDSSQTTQLIFRYLVNGVPVEGEAGIAAVLEYQENILMAAELHLRTFETAGTVRTLMPSTVAAAAATGEPHSLAVGYFAEGTGFVPIRYYVGG